MLPAVRRIHHHGMPVCPTEFILWQFEEEAVSLGVISWMGVAPPYFWLSSWELVARNSTPFALASPPGEFK
jgi:hypothetical protein